MRDRSCVVRAVWAEGPTPLGVFSEVLILQGFKSFVLEVRILKSLQVDFAEVRILKGIVIRETECRSKDRPLQRQWAEAGSLRKLKRELGAETLRARSWKRSGGKEGSDTPPRLFFVRVANKGLMLDAASRNVTGFKVESLKFEGDREEADNWQLATDRSESNRE